MRKIVPSEIKGLEALKGELIPARGDVIEYPKGKILGDYFYVANKTSGVEPGFLGIEMNANFVARFNQQFMTTCATAAECKEYINNARDNQLVAYREKSGQDKMLPFGEALALFANELKKECQSKEANSDLKLYLIKQDYPDSAWYHFGNVAPPIENLQTTSAIKDITKKAPASTQAIVKKLSATLYRLGRLSSRKTENTNAILECLANDIAKLYGMTAQNQRLVFGVYQDGNLKVMTACEWQAGLEMMNRDGAPRFAGSANKEDYENYITDKNDPTKAAKIKGLGEYVAFLFGQGDRDTLGSNFQNKALLSQGNVTIMYAFDFGHAYREANRIVGSLSDDFSFRQPEDVKEKFKNMSAFYDCPMSEKMQSVFYMYALTEGNALDEIFSLDDRKRIEVAILAYAKEYPEFGEKIKAMRDNFSKQNDIFDTYQAQFADLATAAKKTGNYNLAQEYQEYAKAIGQARERAENANIQILRVFKERMQLNPMHINLLENLEKLTSVNYATSSDGKVTLNYLRIDPNLKSRWQFEAVPSDANRISLVTNSTLPEIANLQKYLEPLLPALVNGKMQEGIAALSSLKISSISPMRITIDKKQLAALADYLSEENIREFKRTFSNSPQVEQTQDQAQKILATANISLKSTVQKDASANINQEEENYSSSPRVPKA